MDLRLKHRLVGAVVLIAIGVIFIPMLLDGPPPAPEPVTLERLPPSPGEDYVPRRVDLALPKPGASAPPDEPPAPPPAGVPAAPEPERSAEGGGPAEGWVIQIGSFSRADNARALRDELRAAGYAAFDEPVTGPDGESLTRVRIGPELDRAALERRLAKLKQDPRFSGAIILQHP
ncbi:MAG: SPOR domain-containing protein [Gammaproteobacteria bacterium]|nr:SPOR domain-containing protein [Gammaproteobacteria bacterium]